MEYFFEFNKKTKLENIAFFLLISFFLHSCIYFAVVFMHVPEPETISISLTNNNLQIVNNKPQSKPKQQKPNTPKVQKQIAVDQKKPLPQPVTSNPQPNPTEQTTQNDQNEAYANETVADKSAACTLPEINLTDDATQAGVTSGIVTIDVSIDGDGKVTKAKLVRGTGYNVDNVALKVALTLKCKPAIKEKSSLAVIKRINWKIIP